MHNKIFFFIIPVILFASCSSDPRSRENKAMSLSVADTVQVVAGELAKENKKIIHTAEFKARVDDVPGATGRVERLVTSVGGIISESKTENQTYQTRELYYSRDSQRLVQMYRPVSSLTIRVPVMYFDSVMTTLSGMSAFVDQRTIKQDDATLQYVQNIMLNKADGGSITDAQEMKKTVNTAEYKDARKHDQIFRAAENLQLTDKADMATIAINFYQTPLPSSQIVFNASSIDRNSFLTDTGIALSEGLSFFRTLFMVLVAVWPLWVIAISGVFIYKRYFRKVALGK